MIPPISASEKKDVPVIACIGDSITEGAQATNFYTESYPNQLQTMEGGKYNVINFGMSGRTARTDMASYDSNPIGWIENLQYEGVKAIVPDIAVVKLGTNDSKFSNSPRTTEANFRAALERIIQALLAINDKMEIYMCTSATAYSTAYDISDGNITSIIVPVQLQLAKDYDLPVIDFNTITKNKSNIYDDTIHPSTKGYTMVAEIVKEAIDTYGYLSDSFLADINSRYGD